MIFMIKKGACHYYFIDIVLDFFILKFESSIKLDGLFESC